MTVNQESVVLVAARRSPIGAFQGTLAPLSATRLGSTVIRQVLADSSLQGGDIEQALLGCVLQAGLGQAPARQAVLGAGLPVSTPAMTINKVCGSSLAALVLADDAIRSGSSSSVLAGGMESMSNAPYLLPNSRGGYRMGHQEVLDHIFFDGLQNAYDGSMMGHFAEATVKRYGFTREAQDAYARESVRRALAASEGGAFRREIVPVTVSGRGGDTLVERDEEPFRADPARIPKMKPAFAKDGTVTAASSSSISDGAAAFVVMAGSTAASRGIRPLARVAGHAVHAQEPEWFTTAPVGAIRKLLAKLGWKPDAVDLYEINEAFACVTMAAIKELGLDAARVNVNGGSCALGHPIGATGARLIVTLVHALHQRGGKRGVAALCIGGGEAICVGVEVD
ncbi:MAG: acetyl-CoA C-acyltransferase [Gammaproteobacteria bacterium]|nr:acetyl-CoA C-acyltransferase [Gammaproteobacteria bacterium]